MPTSSLTKNFVIDTEEMAQKFVDAIEKSINDKINNKRKDISVNVKYYADMPDKEKKEFLVKVLSK